MGTQFATFLSANVCNSVTALIQLQGNICLHGCLTKLQAT